MPYEKLLNLGSKKIHDILTRNGINFTNEFIKKNPDAIIEYLQILYLINSRIIQSESEEQPYVDRGESRGQPLCRWRIK